MGKAGETAKLSVRRARKDVSFTVVYCWALAGLMYRSVTCDFQTSWFWFQWSMPGICFKIADRFDFI